MNGFYNWGVYASHRVTLDAVAETRSRQAGSSIAQAWDTWTLTITRITRGG